MKLERFVRSNMANPLLNAIRDYDAGKITLAEYEKIRDSLPMSMKEIMGSIGMDYDGKRDYTRVQTFFAGNRKKINDVMEVFISSGEYQKYRDAGEKDEYIFYRFIIAAISNGIFPFYADRYDDWKLKPLERGDYLYLLQKRLEAISTEVKRRQEEITVIDEKIPIKGMIKRPTLKDGALFKLPPGTMVHCPYTGCTEEFSTDEEFVKHIEDKHRTKEKLFVCPICISGTLHKMERGDYICNECKQIIDKDEVAKFLTKE